jgi:hypothetical protein
LNDVIFLRNPGDNNLILPSKHISQEKALLTVGADLLKRLNKPKTVSSVWEEIRQPATVYGENSRYASYDWFILALDLLYIIGAIEINEGLLTKSNLK